jgi:hypothetical protein
MANKADIDLQAAHTYFSKECFNRAWDYIDKANRNQNEEDLMLQLSLASLWHWSQRKDATPTNLSISYWQVSRAFALMKQAENARHYGELCLQLSREEGVGGYFRGYAYEALARAEMAAGNLEAMKKNLNTAQRIAMELTDPTEKKQLLQDLATIC